MCLFMVGNDIARHGLAERLEHGHRERNGAVDGRSLPKDIEDASEVGLGQAGDRARIRRTSYCRWNRPRRP